MTAIAPVVEAPDDAPRGLLRGSTNVQPLIGMVLVVAAFGVVVFEHIDSTPSAAGLLSTVPGVVVLLFLARAAAAIGDRTRRRSGGPSSLLVAMLYVIFGVFLPGVLLLRVGTHPDKAALLRDLRRPGGAVWMFCVGFSFATLAYFVVGRRSREFLRLNRRALVVNRLHVVFAIGLVAVVLNIVFRGRSIDGRVPLPPVLAPFEQFIGYGETLMLFAIAGAASMPQRQAFYTARVMTGAVCLLGFAEGFMKPTLAALVAYFLGRSLAPSAAGAPRRSRVLVRVPRVAVGVAVLFLMVPLVQATRQQSTDSSFGTDLSEAYASTWGAGLSAGWNTLTDKALGRQGEVLAGAIRAVDRVSVSVELKGFAELVLVPTYAIPRVLWPSKPVLASGQTVSVEFFGAPSDTRSSSSLTLFGDAFWYGGVRAVVVIGLGVGLLLGLIDTIFRVGVAAVCRVALLPSLFDFDSDVAQWVVGNSQAVLVIGVVAVMCSRPAAARAAPAVAAGRALAPA